MTQAHRQPFAILYVGTQLDAPETPVEGGSLMIKSICLDICLSN